MTATDPPSTLFFYGTLMVLPVLQRVIGRDGEGFAVSDAILEEHTRHHVKGEDYPAVVPAKLGSAISGRKLTPEESRVRGSVVEGLTAEDVAFLDEFEGDEYVRTEVIVHALDGSAPTRAETYMWKGDRLHRLEPTLWSFEDFRREKLHRWVGQEAGVEYAEVERRRAMRGEISPRETPGVLPEFGRKMREKYWSFEEGWTNLNHGSYGAAPIPVIKSFREIQDMGAAAPDRWMRKEYMELLIALRARTADFVGCDTDDLVFVNNATTGINAILRSLTTIWGKGDKFLYFSTTIYDACSASLQLVVDTHPNLSLGLVPIHLEYPVTHAKVIEATKKAIAEEEKRGGRIRLALVDALSSNPGVVVPWEELTVIFKEHSIISLIDAAHQIGQLPVNLRESKPDYWVSNCHKWLLGHRGCAVVYAAKPHQHLIHSIPTGHSYAIRPPAPEGTPDWVSEFEWNGTVDWSPILSVAAAFDFREFCGGEERINDYCHRLAIEGGEAVARMLGTETMRNPEGEGELVANMINVCLPIPYPASTLPPAESVRILKQQKEFLYFTQIEQYKTIAPGFTHAGKWWVRLSAQIYNDLDDFTTVGKVLVEVCEKIRNGEFASRGASMEPVAAVE